MNSGQQGRPNESDLASSVHRNDYETGNNSTNGGSQHLGNSYYQNHINVVDPHSAEAFRHLFFDSPIVSRPRDWKALYDKARPIKNPLKFYEEVDKARTKKLMLPTLPWKQFEAQVTEEIQRVWRSCKVSHATQASARELVKQRWMEQGIWNDKWDKDIAAVSSWRWKHEEPPDHGADAPKTGSGQNASIPFNQFLYQLSQEYDRLEPEVRSLEGEIPDDIMTRAAEIVTERWGKQNIWTKEWGHIPGRTWMHEKYIEGRDVPASAHHESRGNDEAGEEPALHRLRPTSPILQRPPMHGVTESHPRLLSEEIPPYDLRGTEAEFGPALNISPHIEQRTSSWRAANTPTSSSNTTRRRQPLSLIPEEGYEETFRGVSTSSLRLDPASSPAENDGESTSKSSSVAPPLTGSIVKTRREDERKEPNHARLSLFLWGLGTPRNLLASIVCLLLFIGFQTYALPIE
ncbi:hypothetical protein BJ875DRAFT_496331 [Amylocarpus encephaloides]|uniref:Uncharacterized protein n=1 Tax=Amylocarpus encephaloides TaxID=45428 RepID=A0A9P7YH60_9HELO|nr:hypothetical protein BJ875DRAFT_496331 [Amylocarpus encephaloides]